MAPQLRRAAASADANPRSASPRRNPSRRARQADTDNPTAPATTPSSSSSRKTRSHARTTSTSLATPTKRSLRSAHAPNPKRRRTYSEDTDDDDDLDDMDELARDDLGGGLAILNISTKQTPKSKATPPHRTPTTKKTPSQKFVAPKANNHVLEEAEGNKSFIPNWLDPRMEHFIWVQILAYAANTADHNVDTHWLLGICSKVGRVLGEAAATVLYRSPVVRSEAKAHALVETLQSNPTMWTYSPKVQTLRLDVRYFHISPTSRRGLDTLMSLFQLLPRLQHVEFFHFKDQAPYRLLEDNLRWTYPEELLSLLAPSALTKSPEDENILVPSLALRLKSWHWSSRMLGKSYDFKTIQSVHLAPVFAQLTKVCFVNFQVPSLASKKDPEDPEVMEADRRYLDALASSISALPWLRHLVFEASTAVNGYLLQLLPRSLKHLELINCWDIVSEEFSNFLLSHGCHLEVLTLHHNQSLNLGFLQHLRAACPRLKELRMNLTYFKHGDLTHDSAKPMYDQLLLEHQVPTWPSSLEVLDLDNLKEWTVSAAEMLLQSLLDSAPELPNLRHLAIKAILSISWRHRSDIRNKWKRKLGETFLRPWVSPRPLTSLRQLKPIDQEVDGSAKKKHKVRTTEGTRRSGRIASQVSEPSSRASSMSRDLRELKRGRPSYQEPDSDEFDSDVDADVDDGAGIQKLKHVTLSEDIKLASKRPFVQGLCTVVDVKFDNGSPAEHKWTEEDFLDDGDDSEDNEWDGDMDSDDEVVF